MNEHDVTTEDLLAEDGAGSPPPGHPRLLFYLEDFAYEYLQTLERRPNGVVLMLAQRRRRREGPGGLVTLKSLLNPKLQRNRLRLIEEVRVASLLEHPAIARVFHLKQYQGRPYAILEHVDGPTLETVVSCGAMRGRPVSPEFAAHVGFEVADALHHAHTRTDAAGNRLGLLHRDVGPRNVRVGRGTGAVALTDFGAAFSCIVGREESPELLLWGDVAYASPEYLFQEELGPASDVFSLGLTLVELLTGRHLFHEGGPPSDTPRPPPGLPPVRTDEEPSLPLELMKARMSRFGPEDVARAVAGLPDALRDILHTALRRAPKERYATAAELRDALRAFLAAGPRPYGRPEVAEEVERLLSEATVLRHLAVPSEGGLFPEELEADEAALADSEEPSAQ